VELDITTRTQARKILYCSLCRIEEAKKTRDVCLTDDLDERMTAWNGKDGALALTTLVTWYRQTDRQTESMIVLLLFLWTL
jgi:hypothetical protein